jgi:hypothetical protein
MKFPKGDLVANLKHLASAATGVKFIGLRSAKDSLDFFVQGDNVVSVLRIPGKSDLPEGMVDSEALQAAIAQCKCDVVNIDCEETDVATLIIGNAKLAMRDAPEIDKLDHKLTPVPDAVASLIADRLPVTFITMPPKTVFGWELRVNKGVARYGSTNGALALYEECDVDAPDYKLTIPHETCIRISKLIPSATGLSMNERLLAVHHDAVTHFVPIMEDATQINLKDVQKLIDSDGVVFCKTANVSEPLQQLLSFADKDSQMLFTIEGGVMQARVSSKIGSNVVDVATFALKEKVNFSCTLRQVMILAKYDSANLRLGVGFRDKVPYVLHAEFDGEKQKKGKDSRKFSHFFMASTTGR